jgi:c-di-GMP-binding flagellar brake protein YcgR
MKPRRILARRDATEIFDRAVRERALAVLTIQETDDWRSFKARFLERDPNARFFVLDYQPVNGETLPPVVPGQYIGVTFRQGSRKLLFATVVEAKGHFVLDDRTTVAAIRYRWPDSMTELQRRAYFRTPVPPSMTLLVSLWPGGITARGSAQASTLQVTTGDLADLSCGGALVRLHQATPTTWLDGEVLGVEMQLPDGRPPVVLDARFRGIRPDESGARSGALQFVGLELTVDGRLVLQRLAASVQRLHRQSMIAGLRDRQSKLKP